MNIAILFRRFTGRGLLAIATLAATLTGSVTYAQDDGITRFAAAVVVFNHTRDKCFYEEALAKEINRLDQTATINAGSRWDRAKQSIELSVNDIPGMIGQQYQPCDAYGFVIGDALMLLINPASDPQLISAASRLVQHGGRQTWAKW